MPVKAMAALAAAPCDPLRSDVMDARRPGYKRRRLSTCMQGFWDCSFLWAMHGHQAANVSGTQRWPRTAERQPCTRHSV